MPYHWSRPIEPIIAITDPEMMKLWAERFGVDLDELKEAIEAAGPGAHGVQEALTGIPAVWH